MKLKCLQKHRGHYVIATQTSIINYSYDPAGRMIAKASDTYEYDNDGNLIKSLENDKETDYVWNSDNRLVKVEKTVGGCKHDKYRKGHGYGHLKHGKPATAYEEYTYLPEDWRRITKKTGISYTGAHDNGNHFGNYKNGKPFGKDTIQTFFSVYDGEDESNEYKLNNNRKIINRRGAKSCARNMTLVKTYISGPNADDIEFTKSKNKSFAMLKDGLGSTIVLSDKNGRSIVRIGYDAWGNFRWSNKAKDSCNVDDYNGYLERYFNTRGFGHKNHNSWGFGKKYKLTPYLYAGRRYDKFTSQYFHRNRFYQPKYGRFTSKDPIGFNGGYNMYGYVGNNPVNRVDPMGQNDIIVYKEGDFLDDILANRVRWEFGYSGVMLLQTDAYWNYKSLFRELNRYGQNGPIDRLAFIGHGSPGKFLFNWLFDYSFIPNTTGDAYFSSDNIFDVTSGCSKSISFSPRQTYFFGCQTADGWPSIAKTWARRVGSRTYGVHGVVYNFGIGIRDRFLPYIENPLGPQVLQNRSGFYRRFLNFFQVSPNIELFQP